LLRKVGENVVPVVGHFILGKVDGMFLVDRAWFAHGCTILFIDVALKLYSSI